MKSSLKSWNPTSFETLPGPWKPEEFPKEAVVDDLELAEKIIALFMPNQVDMSTNYGKKPFGGLVKIPAVPSWNPTELEKLPAFQYDSPIQAFTLTDPIVQPEKEAFLPTVEALMAREQAEAILEDARKQAEELLLSAQVKGQEISQIAYAEAYQKGILSGEEDGLRLAAEETSQQLLLAHQVVAQFKQWKEEMLAQSEGAVLGVIREMAKAMFGGGFELEAAPLERTFNQIMENTRTLGPLKVYVNPEDALNLNPYWRETQMTISGQQIQLIPSDAIQRGGCFVDGEFGSLDARVETQLKTMLNTLEISQKQLVN